MMYWGKFTLSELIVRVHVLHFSPRRLIHHLPPHHTMHAISTTVQYHPQGTPRKRKIKVANMVRLPRDAVDALRTQYPAAESTPSKLIR